MTDFNPYNGENWLSQKSLRMNYNSALLLFFVKITITFTFIRV